MFLLQIWFIGRTLASQAGKAGSIPVICLFEISLKVRESQYLSAFPHFSLFPNQKHFCLKMQHALQVQFLNQSILQYSCDRAARFQQKSTETDIGRGREIVPASFFTLGTWRAVIFRCV